MERYLYSELASLVMARLNCEKTGNSIWFDAHETSIEALVSQHMPHGSGFDSGTQLDFSQSTGEKLVFDTAFHHMSEHGFYDGWTSHRIVVTPSLHFGFHLRVSGRNRNDIKSYIAEEFNYALALAVKQVA